MSDGASSSSNSHSRLPHPIAQLKKAVSLRRSNHNDKESRSGSDGPEPDTTLGQSALAPPGDDSSRKDSFSSTHSSNSTSTSQHSFTQRRIDRGIAVPSSITNWDQHPRSSTTFGSDALISSSTGSYPADLDSSNFFGLSPFVTPSIPTDLLTPYDRPQHYVSLKHRYEREYDGNPRPQSEDEGDEEQGSSSKAPVSHRRSRLSRLDTEDSDIELSDDDFSKSPAGGQGPPSFNWTRPASIRRRHTDTIHNKTQAQPSQASGSAQNTHTATHDTFLNIQDHGKSDTSSFTTDQHGKASIQSASDTSSTSEKQYHQPVDIPNKGIFAERMSMNSQSSQRAHSVTPTDAPLKCDTLHPSIAAESSPPPTSAPPAYLSPFAPSTAPIQPSIEKLRKVLTSYSGPGDGSARATEQGVSALWRLGSRSQTLKAKTEPIRDPPRRHLLQTPVFQVVNANTVKERFLFLFSDLLLICKPIMDESIIVSGAGLSGDREKRFRFRPNENSLFQVKNIVQLSKLTLFLTREDHHRQQQQRQQTHHPLSMASNNPAVVVSTPPSPRKMHPILAFALHEFEKSAERGVSYLIEKHLLTNDPSAIANFLFKTPDLNRRQLGYYLADAKNSEVYNAFLKCFRLAGLRLDEALRILLTTFRLPDNLASLEYVIEVFAKKWHDANQNVVKFGHDMVVKVVELMLQLNSEVWYDSNSEKDVYWHVCGQNSRRMTFGAHEKIRRDTGSGDSNRSSKVVPASGISTQEGFLEMWKHYDRYELVPVDFMEDMFKSIKAERLETGWDNKNKRRSFSDKDDHINVITVSPHRLPPRLTKGVASDPITISIPAPDSGLQIKLRGQDLVCEPNVLDFSKSCVQTFTITGNTLGRTSLMFIKSGDNAGDYVSPTLPRTKSLVVERSFMRHTFDIAFSHTDMRIAKSTSSSSVSASDSKHRLDPVSHVGSRVSQLSEHGANPLEDDDVGGVDGTSHEPTSSTINYTFSVETEAERLAWIDRLRHLCGDVTIVGHEMAKPKTMTKKDLTEDRSPSAEERVALQVLKEVLLADEVKKGTANVAALRTTLLGTSGNHHGTNGHHLPEMVSPKTASHATRTSTSRSPDHDAFPDSAKRASQKEDRGSSLITVAGGVTKRGHEIIKLVVQNSLVPLMLHFLRQQIDT